MEPDLLRGNVAVPVNDRFFAAHDYQNHCFLRKWSHYDSDAVHELQQMVGIIAVHMKDYTFSGKDPTSVAAFYRS